MIYLEYRDGLEYCLANKLSIYEAEPRLENEIKLLSETDIQKDRPILFNELDWELIKHKCPWYNGYRRRKWNRWLVFKSWTKLIAFHIELKPLGKVRIQLFSLQLWVNSGTDYVLQPWWGN